MKDSITFIETGRANKRILMEMKKKFFYICFYSLIFQDYFKLTGSFLRTFQKRNENTRQSLCS